MFKERSEGWVESMVKVKVCGLTSAEEAEMVCDLGVDFLGVINQVDVSTPREVDMAKAEDIIETVPKDVKSVIITMVEELEKLKIMEKKFDPDYIQLHSEPSESQLKNLKKNIETGIIGVLSISSNHNDSEQLISKAKRRAEIVDLLLLDTEGPHEGYRMTHDWDISSKIVNSLETQVILAGGLTSANVEEAVETVDPYAVDVASGVESKPGKKSLKLVKEFIERGEN